MILSISKLGPHCQRPTASARALIDAGARVIKLVSDLGLANEIEPLPGRLVIGRSVSQFDAQSQFHGGEEPKAAARRFIDSQKDIYKANPLIRVWEGHNEPVFNETVSMMWYEKFELERMRLMADMGLRCVVGNWSTGNPEPDMFGFFIDVLVQMDNFKAILGLHEYSSPWMWWLTGPYQQQPGAQTDDSTGWTTLRYRKIIQRLGELRPPIVITECGLDRIGQVRPGMPSGNWRTNAAWWNAQNSADGPIPYNPDHERYYADQLIWYDRELQKDPYVLGACVFTLGHDNPAWTDYDIEGTRAAVYIAQHLRASATPEQSPPVPTPAPTPAPQPIPEPPMPTPSPTPSTNLLDNADLYSGGFYLIPGTDNRRVPNRWRLTYKDGLEPRLPGMDDNEARKPWLPPETQFRSNDGRPRTELLNVSEHSLYLDFARLIYVVFHIFKGWGKMWWELLQDLNNLPSGRYRWRAEMYADIYFRDGVNRNFPHNDSDAQTGEWRLDVSEHPDLDWSNGATAPGPDPARRFYGHWLTLVREFDHLGGALTVSIEARCRYGVDVVGFFLRALSLERIGDLPGNEPPPEEPPAQTSPDNDTLTDWAERANINAAQSIKLREDISKWIK